MEEHFREFACKVLWKEQRWALELMRPDRGFQKLKKKRNCGMSTHFILAWIFFNHKSQFLPTCYSLSPDIHFYCFVFFILWHVIVFISKREFYSLSPDIHFYCFVFFILWHVIVFISKREFYSLSPDIHFYCFVFFILWHVIVFISKREFYSLSPYRLGTIKWRVRTSSEGRYIGGNIVHSCKLKAIEREREREKSHLKRDKR